jgi:uncharacterized protein (DUF2384 family)
MATLVLHEAKREAFTQVLGVTPDRVENAVLHNQLVGEPSLDAVLENFAKLLEVGKLEALGVLGVSRSRKSRNPMMNVELLDRVYSALDIYARIATLIGTKHAPEWFQTPKQALDGARPIDLLATRIGLHKLTNMVTALEDGSYL